MDLGLSNTLLPGDPRLIDHIVAEVKSQGIFDQFRKECIADVDTKPAYQNLNARVESSVNTFLNKQTWRADLNKNQLRETLRKHIHDAPYLEVGVDRIVDQVVNPKVYSVFMPKIEDVVYKFLGIERPKSQRNGTCDLKDLLPTDLDPVSPESDRGSIKDESMELVSEDEKKIINGDEQKPSVSNVESKPVDVSASPVKKENIEIENEKDLQAMDTSAVLNTSFKSEEGLKTEEEEEESPDFEPIDIMNLNESNMSNDSHLSGISELTSHRSASPDFATEFARDNFDCSNQDSQLSKVSSNSRLSIVTDIGSSNHGSTPKSDAKEDSKGIKDNFKSVKEFDSNKDSKFNFDVAKIKDYSKTSSSSKESSRDASDYKDSKSKDESKGKSSIVKHESRSSRDKNRDSRRRHSSKRRHRSKSKDKTDTDSQESKDFYQKPKEIKIKEMDKKDDASDEITDLKDRYKEKIRELREKIELTEKGKLGKINLDLSKDKKDSVAWKDKEEPKKSSHRPSSSRSSSHHSKSSRSSENKESRDKSSSRHEERRHANGKGESKSSSKSRRDSKSDSRSSDRSRDKKRRDEKKSKPTDDHSSLRKNLNDRRSSDRDGSDGSSSKYSHKTSFSANTSSSKFGPTSELTKDNKEQHSSGETESVHDSLHTTFKANDGLPKKVDPGSSEICLPLKKRRLLSEESQDEGPTKKKRCSERKTLKRKLEHLDSFKSDSDVASVPDEERVQIVEYADEEYDQPYPDKELVLSLEETKKIILDAEPMPPPQPTLSEMELSIRQSLSEMMGDHKMTVTDDVEPVKVSTVMDSKPAKDAEPMPPPQSNLSEMELSIRQSLSEMMADHKMSETDDVEPVKVSTVMDSSSLLEALTDDSSTDKDTIVAACTEDVILDSKVTDVEKSDLKIEGNNGESIEKLEPNKESEAKTDIVEKSDVKIKENNDESTEKLDLNKESETKIEIIEKSDVKIKENNGESAEKLDQSKESETKIEIVEKSDVKIKENNGESAEKLDQSKESETKVENVEIEENKEISEGNKEEKNEKDGLCVENQLEQFEAFDDDAEDIVEKTNEKVSEVQENTEKVVSEVEKSTENIEEPSNEKTEQNFDDTKKVDVEPDTKNSDEINQHTKNTYEIEQDKENVADFDESNEDDTLVIDEEVEEKEKDCVEKPKVTENLSEIEKIEENEKKNSDDSQLSEVEIKEVLPKDNSANVQNNTEDELNNKPTEQINNKDVEKLNGSEINDVTHVKSSEVTEEAKEETKDQLINELAKLDGNETEQDKNEIKESTSDEGIGKDDAPIEIIRLDDSPAKSVDTTKMDSDDDSDIDIVEIKDDDIDDKESQSTCNPDEKLENIPEFEPLVEDSLDLEKSPEVNAIEDIDPLAQDPLAVEKSDETSTDPLATDDKIIDDEEPVEEAHCSKDTQKESPIEEDCRYFDNDNQKYLSFKKYLDQLEAAEAVKVTEEKIESPIIEVPPPVVEPLATVSVSLKRKYSPSPIADNIIIKDNNNDGLTTTKESVLFENVSNKQAPIEEPVMVVKKRKVGRMKKSSSSGSVASSTSQPEQPQDKEPQPQVPMVNGENFMMPLSPESDISVSSDKNLGGTLKDERRGQRSSQRYSSDDLYKPRPAFTSSSRRTRRYHQT